jgi:proteasome lid subunit RPN8/RPN11
MADQQPVAKVSPDTQGVDNLDTCANGVLGSLEKYNGEAAGVIMQGPDGKYYNTDPIDTPHDHFGMRVQLQKGWKIAGIYHTHPGQDELGQYFSTNDLAVSESLKVPSYIRFQKDGSVRRYTPGQTKTQNMAHAGDRFGMRVARGDDLSPPPSTQQSAATPTSPADPTQPKGS